LGSPRGSGVEGATRPGLVLIPDDRDDDPYVHPNCSTPLLLPDQKNKTAFSAENILSGQRSSFREVFFSKSSRLNVLRGKRFFLKQTISICKFYVYSFIPISTIKTTTTELYFPARYLKTFYIQLLTPQSEQLRVVPLNHSSPINNTRRTFAEN